MSERRERDRTDRDEAIARRPRRKLVLRGALVGSVAAAALVLLQYGRTLEADAPPAATLGSPDGATVSIGKPYFVWEEEETATEYRLVIDDSSATVVDEWFDAEEVCASGTCAVTSPESLPNDAHTWWIQTKNGEGTGPLSSSMSFDVVAYGVVDGGSAHTVSADRDGRPPGLGGQSVRTSGRRNDARPLHGGFRVRAR